MIASALNTMRLFRRLEDSGFTRDQAVGMSEAFLELFADSIRDLATKSDVALVRSELKGEMDAFRSELRGEMATFRAELKGEMDAFRTEIRATLSQFESRMTIKLGGIIILALGAMTALNKLI